METPKGLTTFYNALTAALPGIQFGHDEPNRPEGVWFFSVAWKRRGLFGQWQKGKGFGFSRCKEYLFGERPHEYYRYSPAAAARVADLLRNDEYTHGYEGPPEPAPATVRKRTARSQAGSGAGVGVGGAPAILPASRRQAGRR